MIEDGSSRTCKHIIDKYRQSLDIHYFEKQNTGQGFTRNFGFERANGEYFVVFDSDCLIPHHYFDAVNKEIEKRGKIDCWGGPDRAHKSFTPVQKAINYSMTSFFTTGGTRGSKRHVGKYHPRSFNMGISREVFKKTGGYIITRMGEDLEFSIRIQKAGFELVFIEDAFVYHKRRTDFMQFYRQLFFFGRARINIRRFHSEQLKLIHCFPLLFTLALCYAVIGSIVGLPLANLFLWLYVVYAFILGMDAFRRENMVLVALYAPLAGFIQLTAYGFGFISESFRRTGNRN